ncbi:hypothetical protein [Vibrio crassostreae]|uniref:hypothetical protein n=1 Tax=Vibrio crassostreae TaxID=246167 RepID=UPI0010536E73|nr:hypothetical protein [Vibrio crassostreae]TCO01801.1 hypothetical protein EDB51_10681 [Vibrio crassostreae]CAK2036151.1 General porin [Vibrio crassostreae]CAK2046630.1 General porin [Vibrio crassostreae]CAK2073144.1 General porin [Vibrio crassostreae]CAK2078638.1 General porin [Vibrio crassostreae]
MKTQLVTLSSLFVLSFSGAVAASDMNTKEDSAKDLSIDKNYHSQDVRNVQSNIKAGYETIEDLDLLSVEGTYGINDKASVSVGYKQLGIDGYDETSDVMTLSGQYNISNNIVIDGEWNISGDYDNLTVGGNYVADAGFGAWNVGANYSTGDVSDGFDLEAGVLLPFGNMYYRGDFTYFLDSDYDSVFENALGWTNGNIDINASVTMYEFDDTSVGIEFGYFF